VKVKQELLTEENVPDAGVSEMPAMGRHPVSALAISKIMQTSIPPQELVQTASLLEDTEDSQDTVDDMDVLLETVQQPEKPAGLEAARNEG